MTVYNLLVKLTQPLSPQVLKTTQPFIDSLSSMGIRTVEALLLNVPRAYEDLSHVVRLLDAPLNEKVTVRGTIHALKLVRTRTKKVLVQARFRDDDGTTAQVVWFNQPHIMRMLSEGQMVTLTGKIIEDGYKLSLQSPQFEDASKPQQLHAGRIVAVYAQSDQITSRWLREKISHVSDVFSSIPETLPKELLQEEGLVTRAVALRELHLPTTPESLEAARKRMSFEEMYRVQIEALERKKLWQGEKQSRLVIPMDVELVKAFFASLQFTPTPGQKIAIYEILKDMEQDRPMSRLLEGDVGSGKTLVAVTVIASVLAQRGQSALMVPTEVLARQHAATIARTLMTYHSYLQKKAYKEKGIKADHLTLLPAPRVGLLTGSLSFSESSALKRDLAAGLIDVLIGTHALIEESVKFRDLKLVIIDEQHRFGVAQRRALAEKGNPHVLSMTATPIPRTLALTAYGDHDLSVLLEKPGQRKRIITKVVSPKERRTVDLFIDAQIAAGKQVYVICPLISESKADEMAEIKNVEQELQRLIQEFPSRRIEQLHGKMYSEEKASVMQRFKDRAFDILVSTSVIEVGIDVPNAVIIVIEGAERFGLSQLHQFRGRVGRSDDQSYCYLFTTTQEQARSERLKAMEDHDSGFLLAEIDLKLRGPGEVFGLRQSGIPEIRFGGLMNVELVLRARKAAERFLGVDHRKRPPPV